MPVTIEHKIILCQIGPSDAKQAADEQARVDAIHEAVKEAQEDDLIDIIIIMN